VSCIMKNVFITGTSRGIGRAVAERCLTAGFKVYGLARRADAFEHEHYIPLCCDLNSMPAVEETMRELRSISFSKVILAAGYGRFTQLEGFSAAQMQEIMQVNFTSQAYILRCLVPDMKKQQRGGIIVVGSEAALQGAKRGTLYCASKFALRGLCQSLRAETRNHNISVSLVNPGLVRSDFFEELDFMPGEELGQALVVSQVADQLMHILAQPAEVVIEEITLQPMAKHIIKG